jgi:hypothetical protein
MKTFDHKNLSDSVELAHKKIQNTIEIITGVKIELIVSVFASVLV